MKEEKVNTYVQKPKLVEAMQVPHKSEASKKKIQELINWLDDCKVEFVMHGDGKGFFLKGIASDSWPLAAPGEWIVRDEYGSVCIMSEQRFQNTFMRDNNMGEWEFGKAGEELKFDNRIQLGKHLAEKVRPIIQKAAVLAELKMSHNDASKGDSWKTLSMSYLEGKLVEEVREYFEKGISPTTRAEELADIIAVASILIARLYNAEEEEIEEDVCSELDKELPEVDPEQCIISIDRIAHFVDFLMGENIPENYKISPTHVPELTTYQAWEVVKYLQDVLKVLPTDYEMCCICGGIMDKCHGKYGDFLLSKKDRDNFKCHDCRHR
jgi:predicted house-cleaning noncanonical NTP pyrophosphatase (MazG superfamily)